MTIQPILTGRDIGITYAAIAALREQLLAGVGITFEDSILLNTIDDNGGSATRHELVAVLVSGLKISEEQATHAVTALISRELAAAVETSGSIVLSATGADAHGRFTAAVAQAAPTIYGGIDPVDLAAAKRVLDTVTERANRELEHTA